MTLKEYLAEVKQRAHGHGPGSLTNTDIPRLIAIVEAQAEALEFYAKGKHLSEKDYDEVNEESVSINKTIYTDHIVGKRAREALAKAEAIAGGEG